MNTCVKFFLHIFTDSFILKLQRDTTVMQTVALRCRIFIKNNRRTCEAGDYFFMDFMVLSMATMINKINTKFNVSMRIPP